MSVFRIGTRASRLAMAQTKLVLKLLKKKNPHVQFRIIPIQSRGDRDQSLELFQKNAIGVFTKAIESKLMQGAIDVAVHSLKDLPTELPKALRLGAVPKRGSSADVLVSRKKWDLKTLPPGSVVGTGSPRRKRQLLILRPDVRVLDMRGNLDTRIKKALKRQSVDAVMVAEAGLNRIQKYSAFARRLDPRIFLPAVGQGALALEIRKSDARASVIVGKLNDKATELMTTAERVFLRTLRGGCRVPVGIHSTLQASRLTLKAAVFSVRTDERIEHTVSGPVVKKEALARSLAEKLLKNGADRFLKEARER